MLSVLRSKDLKRESLLFEIQITSVVGDTVLVGPSWKHTALAVIILWKGTAAAE